MNSPFLELCGLKRVVSRPGGDPFVIFDEINIRVREGEFISLVGPSGCGKTTLLRVISALIPATSGKILVEGQEVAGGDGKLEVGFVFQGASLLPWRTSLKNVTLGLEAKGHKAKECVEKARHFPNLVGLSGFEDYYPHQLSGGMQQRVNLARALAVDPKVLLMDEPFASLDAQTRSFMQLELLKIWQRAKKTVIFVTHMISEAILLSDRVLVLSRRPGRIRSEFEVDIDRPRNIESKANLRFIELENLIWHQIEEEVRSLGEFPATEEIPSEAERSSGASGTL